MPPVSSAKGAAAVLTLLSAFAWATYYIFVLAITAGTTPSAILVYPFLFGGIPYALWAVLRGHGAAFVRLWRSPAAYLRISLLVGMQLSVLASTYLTGPVDAALLSLLGDIVVTPLLVAYVFGAHRRVIQNGWFALGAFLSMVGGAMAIAGGTGVNTIHDWGWLAVPAVPLTVAFYFLLTARANQETPASAVVGQSMLGATLVTALVAPAIPGGWAGLAVTGPIPVAVLLATGLTSFFLAPVLYFDALARGGLVIPPMLMTGIPVFTLLLSAVVLHLSLPFVALLGIPVAVVGSLVALRGELRSTRDPTVPLST